MLICIATQGTPIEDHTRSAFAECDLQTIAAVDGRHNSLRCTIPPGGGAGYPSGRSDRTCPRTGRVCEGALLARRRLAADGSGYRLLDARPLEPEEPESVARPPRRKPSGGSSSARGGRPAPTYADVGHVAIERLIELGREVATLRAGARSTKSEAREARLSKEDAERRAQTLAARVQDLEAKLEMAEQNMRALLAAAKGREEQIAPGSEMDARLSLARNPRAGRTVPAASAYRPRSFCA